VIGDEVRPLLQDQHSGLRLLLQQPMRHHRAGAAGTDHYVVEVPRRDIVELGKQMLVDGGDGDSCAHSLTFCSITTTDRRRPGRCRRG
jgi:hypothetical protein